MPDFKKPLINKATFTKSTAFIRYVIPVLLIALATIIKIWLNDYIGYKTPFLIYFGVVIVTSRYLGKKAAIVATILSAAVAGVFFTYPLNSFTISKEAAVQLILFIAECGLLIGFSGALFKAVNIMNENDIRFRTLVEKSSEGIITVNAGGKITYCSPSVQNILGYTDEEFAALPAWHLLHPDEALEIKEQYYRFAAHPGKNSIMTHQMRHKNGEYIWIESQMTNLLGEPPINAVIANFMDITDRIHNDRLREDFISIASHELKTPLTSLKAYTQVLQNRFKSSPNDPSTGIINKIDQQVTKVIQMVTNLLDVTTLQQKKLNLNIRMFDLNVLANEIVESVQQTTKSHRITIQLTSVEQISGDRERLGQVLTNLIANAIKYSPNADIVNVTSRVADGQVVLSVQDYGIGIPQSDVSKVFARFYRVDGSRNVFQGLGLGLYICAQIIEHHGGRIGVESEEHKGSVFWFSLPLK